MFFHGLSNTHSRKWCCLLLFLVVVFASCNKDSVNSIYGTWDFKSVKITNRAYVFFPNIGHSIFKEDTGEWNSIVCSGSIEFQQEGKATFISADGERVPALYSYNDKEQYIEFYQVSNFNAVIDFSGSPETISIGPGIARGNEQSQYKIRIEKGTMTMIGKFWHTISDNSWWYYENAVATFKKR